MIKHIPNIITLSNLMCGFVAITLNDIYWSPLLILLGAVFDMFDGMAARAMKVDGRFGLELDTLADMVNFGIAPALLYWHHFLDGSWLSYLVIGFIPALGAWRLATFNLAINQGTHFRGLAIPSAGLFIAFFVFDASQMTKFSMNLTQAWVIYLIPIFIGIMMVVPLKMFSLKGFKSKRNAEKILLALLILLGLFCIATFGFSSIPIIVLSYVFLSILGNIFRWI